MGKVQTKDVNVDVLNSENTYKFTLPSNGKEIEFKLLTHGDEQDITTETQVLENYPRLSKESLQAVFAYIQECLHDGLLYGPTQLST